MRLIVSWRIARRVSVLVLAMSLVAIGLFSFNGLAGSWSVPEIHGAVTAVPSRSSDEVRILALNIAKVAMYEGGVSFADEATVRRRLDRIAEAVRATSADVVALSEVVFEAGPCPVDQAAHLARALEFPIYALGENYSFGLPFYRIRSGNALLSRFPLRGKVVQALEGQRPFYSPTNNRRALWCELLINNRWVTCASIRNDSFDLRRNHRHAQQILSLVPEDGAIVAGDFNAEMKDPSMMVFYACGRFTGTFDGAPTFPARSPRRCIDFVLAPKNWTLVEQRTLTTDVSDHLAVLAVFRLP